MLTMAFSGGFEAEVFNHPAPRTADEAESWVLCPVRTRLLQSPNDVLKSKICSLT